jgi:ribosomal-protein-alanine N-acetyltransferase
MNMTALGMDDLVFERGTSQDLDRIMSIEHDSFSAPWTRKMFEVELDSNPFGHLVTVQRRRPDGRQSEIMGYICFWVVFDELRLMTLAVDRAIRRQGVATALVHQAMAQGGSLGAVRAVLEVRASNEVARRLYERMGFRQVAVRARYYANPTEDAVLMETDLPQVVGPTADCPAGKSEEGVEPGRPSSL